MTEERSGYLTESQRARLEAELAELEGPRRARVVHAIRTAREHGDLIKNLRRGDTVVTSGGLVGKVTKVVDDDQIEFEISDGVRVRQMRQMISGVRAKGEPAKEKAEIAKDETSAS